MWSSVTDAVAEAEAEMMNGRRRMHEFMNEPTASRLTTSAAAAAAAEASFGACLSGVSRRGCQPTTTGSTSRVTFNLPLDGSDSDSRLRRRHTLGHRFYEWISRVFFTRSFTFNRMYRIVKWFCSIVNGNGERKTKTVVLKKGEHNELMEKKNSEKLRMMGACGGSL